MECAGFPHCVQESQPGLNVIFEALLRVLDGLRHDRRPGKMHDRIHFPKDREQFLSVRDVSHHTVKALRQAGMSGRKVVIHPHGMPVLAELPRRMASDIPRASCNQHPHLLSKPRSLGHSVSIIAAP